MIKVDPSKQTNIKKKVPCVLTESTHKTLIYEQEAAVCQHMKTHIWKLTKSSLFSRERNPIHISQSNNPLRYFVEWVFPSRVNTQLVVVEESDENSRQGYALLLQSLALLDDSKAKKKQQCRHNVIFSFSAQRRDEVSRENSTLKGKKKLRSRVDDEIATMTIAQNISLKLSRVRNESESWVVDASLDELCGRPASSHSSEKRNTQSSFPSFG